MRGVKGTGVGQAVRTKRYRDKRLSEGLCWKCRKPLDKDRKICIVCREEEAHQRLLLKLECLAHYGNKCVCCGESNSVFLCFDHKDGKGAEHRRSIYPHRPNGGRGNGASGVVMQFWIRKHNYPDIFQILCFNCNSAKHILGICPHQQETQCNQNLSSELKVTAQTATA